ncbi:MAG TPA: hypothetical protein EYP35_08340 [Desulfobacterales bacterium]|nr:hypothetical protein [Desulfobacterales bacterium]
MAAADYDQIVNLFQKYTENTKTKVITTPGFKRYLLQNQAFPAWIVRKVMDQVADDVNLKYHLDTIVEAELIEGACLGTLKDTPTKMLLKKYFGYKDNYDALNTEGQVVKTIQLKPAELPSPKE